MFIPQNIIAFPPLRVPQLRHIHISITIHFMFSCKGLQLQEVNHHNRFTLVNKSVLIWVYEPEHSTAQRHMHVISRTLV